ncbi:tellurium resistance protein [Pelagivirga sediminicola]|uniref:Tellurium resistance protein n=1 Tax=Pelagivirga sediminicola TaxID=2170575 RepID=A0A2T7G9A4_9RHOB|nr:TrgA family protein [Pelagivirga sediminicola]PVA11002.1 tellurium resistance protein [Pelagivirga sediminicola]
MPKTRTLPTAARLVAAIALGALGWLASEMVRPLMPPQTAFGWFNYVNLALGVLCGWFVIGSRAGRGYGEALANGLTGVLALIIWGFFVQSFNLMLKQSMEGKFDGPVEAIVGIFNNAIDYAQYLIDPALIGTLLVGGMICGLLAEMAARRWT